MNDVTVGSRVGWDVAEVDGCSILRRRSEIGAHSVRMVGDDLMRFVMDRPRAVMLVVEHVRPPTLAAVFAARSRTTPWPDLPIVLVAEAESGSRTIESPSGHDDVAVFPSVPDALSSLPLPHYRRRASVELFRHATCTQRARRFVSEILRHWDIPRGVHGDALFVATELVENAFLYTRGVNLIGLQLEHFDKLLVVAVTDADPRPATFREHTPGATRFYGLQLISRIASAWGCVPLWSGGKVVWAALNSG